MKFTSCGILLRKTPVDLCKFIENYPHNKGGSTKMYAMLHCGGNLPLCLAFGTGVLGVLWLGGWH